MGFKQLKLNEDMLSVVDQLYFKKPTAIQEKAIPTILDGKNMIGQSQTGSGKTHAYLLPLMNKINEDKNEVQIVITTPTRELAMQIHEEVKEITAICHKKERWRSRLLIGGMDRPRMMRQLTHPPHIIIGTPGRILDMINENVLSLYSATSFVIDEADLMFELNFLQTIDQLLVRCQKHIQTLVFSATIPKPLQHFINKYLEQPVHIKIDSDLSPETLEHRLINKRHRNDAEIISNIANIIQPYVAILFVNSKEKADELSNQLREMGLDVGVLHGGLSSRERNRAVRDITHLRYQYIVATDLASRGIDIKGASHVINVELPKEVDFYIHRVGRTARAGRSGMAISIFHEADFPLIEKLEKRGIIFNYYDVKNNEWMETKQHNHRAKRRQKTSNLDKEAWKKVRKPKKIKPGYKKKMKQEQEQIKRRLKNKRKRKSRR